MTETIEQVKQEVAKSVEDIIKGKIADLKVKINSYKEQLHALEQMLKDGSVYAINPPIFNTEGKRIATKPSKPAGKNKLETISYAKDIQEIFTKKPKAVLKPADVWGIIFKTHTITDNKEKARRRPAVSQQLKFFVKSGQLKGDPKKGYSVKNGW